MATVTATDPVCSPAAYEGLGWFYDRYWRNVSEKLMPALDQLALSKLPRGSRVLDLCCGTGHLAAAICRRGLAVTGLDGSPDMLRFARANARTAEFVAADARGFHLPGAFQAVISTGDSVNHMLTPEDVGAVFSSVFRALAPGGLFVFDLNMAHAFETEWHKSSTVSGPDHLMYVHGRYHKPQRLGSTEVTVFTRTSAWTRLDFTIFQRCYRLQEIKRALIEAGFTDIAAYPAKSFGIRGRLAIGRTFFSARVPPASPSGRTLL